MKNHHLKPGCGLFTFNELDILFSTTFNRNMAIRKERESNVERLMQIAYISRESRPPTEKKRGEPDWQEVEHDAQREFGRKILGEYEY